jgi:hypothetical protein
VHIPREQIGQTIFENLLPETKSEHMTGREILIDPELVVRESTGLAREAPSLPGSTEKSIGGRSANP